MDAEANKAQSPEGHELPDGLSAFIARVLNQLTLSAWLPASLLLAGCSVLVSFRQQRSADISATLRDIGDNPWRLLVVALPLLVVATLITQAFSFEAIRTLEGYWRRRGPASWLRTLMIRLHVWRKDRLRRRRLKASARAFTHARPRLLLAGTPATVVAALELQVLGGVPTGLSLADETAFKRLNWRTTCNAWDLARVDHLTFAEMDYPTRSRVLPTRLGNLIRATEDRLTHGGADIEGFALRRRGLSTARVQMQHDQYRVRLDMYCTLVFVSALLAAVTPPSLWGRVTGQVLWTMTTGCLVFAASCYGAAIASARGYCAALKQMDANPVPTQTGDP